MQRARKAVADLITVLVIAGAVAGVTIFLLKVIAPSSRQGARHRDQIPQVPFGEYVNSGNFGSQPLNMYQRPGIAWTLAEPAWNRAVGRKHRKEFRDQMVANLQETMSLHTGWWRAGIRFRYVPKEAEAAIVVHPLNIGEAATACHSSRQFGCTHWVSQERCTINLAYWVRYVTYETWDYDVPSPGNVNQTLGRCFGLPVTHGGAMDPRGFNAKPSRRLIARVRKLLNTKGANPMDGEREIEVYHPRKRYLLPVESSTNLYRRWMITWTVLRPRWGSILEQPFRAELHYQLVNVLRKQIMDPRGWQRSGIRFRYVARPDEANIIFASTTPAHIKSDCYDNKADGCETTLGTGRCFISLEYNIIALTAKTWRYYRPEEATVNHEMGHCFNFRHTKGGVMDPYGRGDVQYPGPRLIHELRQQLLDPKESPVEESEDVPIKTETEPSEKN